MALFFDPSAENKRKTSSSYVALQRKVQAPWSPYNSTTSPWSRVTRTSSFNCSIRMGFIVLQE